MVIWLGLRRDECSYEQHMTEINETLFDVATICRYYYRFRLIESGTS
jgi:hypothetical protein